MYFTNILSIALRMPLGFIQLKGSCCQLKAVTAASCFGLYSLDSSAPAKLAERDSNCHSNESSACLGEALRPFSSWVDTMALCKILTWLGKIRPITALAPLQFLFYNLHRATLTAYVCPCILHGSFTASKTLLHDCVNDMNALSSS
ncbi:TPA: hypothetical protein ACH3X2_005887 [Trebouxia sp. C0005]